MPITPHLSALDEHDQTDEAEAVRNIVASVRYAGLDRINNGGHACFGANGIGDQVFLNEDGLAERWHVSKKTLQRWRSHGEGIPHYKIQRRVIYAMSDVIQFESQAARVSTSERAR